MGQRRPGSTDGWEGGLGGAIKPPKQRRRRQRRIGAARRRISRRGVSPTFQHADAGALDEHVVVEEDLAAVLAPLAELGLQHEAEEAGLGRVGQAEASRGADVSGPPPPVVGEDLGHLPAVGRLPVQDHEVPGVIDAREGHRGSVDAGPQDGVAYAGRDGREGGGRDVSGRGQSVA